MWGRGCGCHHAQGQGKGLERLLNEEVDEEEDEEALVALEGPRPAECGTPSRGKAKGAASMSHTIQPPQREISASQPLNTTTKSALMKECEMMASPGGSKFENGGRMCIRSQSGVQRMERSGVQSETQSGVLNLPPSLPTTFSSGALPTFPPPVSPESSRKLNTSQLLHIPPR